MLIAALCRALVDTEARRWRAGAGQCRGSAPRCCASPRGEPAARGWTTPCSIPAPASRNRRRRCKTLLDHVRDALDEAGDTAAVSDLLAEVLARGNGATFQRSHYHGDGSVSEMIDSAAAATIR